MSLRHRVAVLAERILGPRYVMKRRVAAALQHGEPEIALLPLLADPDRDFVDVGANKGIYSYFALAHFRSVIALEANPKLARKLEASLVPNGKVLAVALSDREGVAKLWIPHRDHEEVDTRSSLEAGANAGFDQHEIDVPMTTLDKLGLDAVAVVKIDVEGHEFAVLNGAVSTLQTLRPVVILECEERHNPGGVARVFAFFRELGYGVHYLHRKKLCEGDAFDVGTLQRQENAKQFGGGRSSDYINNFIFIPLEREDILSRVRADYA